MCKITCSHHFDNVKQPYKGHVSVFRMKDSSSVSCNYFLCGVTLLFVSCSDQFVILETARNI